MLIQSNKIENSFLNDKNLKIMRKNEIKKRERLIKWEINEEKSHKKQYTEKYTAAATTNKDKQKNKTTTKKWW